MTVDPRDDDALTDALRTLLTSRGSSAACGRRSPSGRPADVGRVRRRRSGPISSGKRVPRDLPAPPRAAAAVPLRRRTPRPGPAAARPCRAASARPPATRRPVSGVAGLAAALGDVVDHRDRGHVWLVLAALTGRLPDHTTVVEVARAAEFDDGASLWTAVAERTTARSALTAGARRRRRGPRRRRPHRGDPAGHRHPARRPGDDPSLAGHPAVHADLAGPTATNPCASPTATELGPFGATAPGAAEEAADTTVVVPWRATYVVPELAAEPERSARLLALAALHPQPHRRHRLRLVPLTRPRRPRLGFAGVFARQPGRRPVLRPDRDDLAGRGHGVLAAGGRC